MQDRPTRRPGVVRRKRRSHRALEILPGPYTVESARRPPPHDDVLVWVSEWPGCVATGATRGAAEANLRIAMRDWARQRLRLKEEIPPPSTGAEPT